jgi:hypothetical protein
MKYGQLISSEDDRPIMGANWCVKCQKTDKKYSYATFIYNGNSLCELCFMKIEGETMGNYTEYDDTGIDTNDTDLL